ncbi:hypothetical protein QBC41DRAFT_112348 [Cercophora samala]|uniref:Uncharacterized protein n=1 Tax=Cercophora samala TaxID=330535 RepID=A0AA40DBL6_9PEZI|nr:hypothetical protein QBC41DRAFT_112348 [Cercophora samala]
MAPLLLLSLLDSIIPPETPRLQPRRYFSNGTVNPLAIGLGAGLGIPFIVGVILLYWREELKKKKRKEEREAEEEIYNSRLRGQAAQLGAGKTTEPRRPLAAAKKVAAVDRPLGVPAGPGGGDRPRNLGLLDITTPLPNREPSPDAQGDASTGAAVPTTETTAVNGSEPAITEPPPAYSKYKPGLLDV